MKKIISLAVLLTGLTVAMASAPAAADPVVIANAARGPVGSFSSQDQNAARNQQAQAYRLALAYRAAAARHPAGGCARGKPAFGDADFSFQGYNDADIPC